MEYVDGENLSFINHRCRKAGTHVPYALAARIVAWACEGLHHAHELVNSSGESLGLVHRDVSPQNILVSYDGVVKLSDFGIAKVANRSAAYTQPGQVKGKIAYLAPEQIHGQPVDRRTDIFSLGVVLYETCVGERLFQEENDFETMRRIIEGDVPPPASKYTDFPIELERIITGALQADPAHRYQTARDFQRDLENYLAGIGRPSGTAELADYLEGMFKDRMTVRRAKLHAIPDEEMSKPQSIVDLVTPISQSVVLNGAAAAPAAPSRKPWKMISVVLAALIIGGALTWALSSDRGAASGSTNSVSAVVTPMPQGQAPRPVPIGDETSQNAGQGELDAANPVDAAPAKLAEDAAPRRDRPPRRPQKSQRPQRPQKASPEGPPGTLSIMANPWCDVFLDGKRIGRTPIIRRQVPSGRHSLKLLPQGKQPAVRRGVVVRPGQETPLNINLAQ
jgi:serine/threonine-protein kinase